MVRFDGSVEWGRGCSAAGGGDGVPDVVSSGGSGSGSIR